MAFIDVTGFSLAELGAQALAPLWWRGGFPRAYLAHGDDAARRWIEDFRRTFLEPSPCRHWQSFLPEQVVSHGLGLFHGALPFYGESRSVCLRAKKFSDF